MADTVNVPGIGKPVPKWAAFGGLAVTGVLIIIYYRKKSAQNASAQTAAQQAAAAGTYQPYPGGGSSSGDTFPWDGTYDNPSDPYSMDTTTGVTYGDEGAFGGVSTGGGGGGGSTQPGTGLAGGPPFSNNSEWSNWVIAEMTAQNTSLDPGTLTDALGLYLAGQPVSPAQKTLVFDAIAVGGDPPQSGTGGYPPAVRTQGTTSTGSHVTVPDVTGFLVSDATAALTRAGLRYKLGSTQKPGVTYKVKSQSPGAGASEPKGTVITLAIEAESSGSPPPHKKPPPPKPKPKPGPETAIPRVAGLRASYAVSAVEAKGFEAVTSPLRDPRREYTATGTTPSGRAPKGSRVTIHVRVT